MNTTLIFAEILIIGLEVGIWLLLFLLSLFGIENLNKILPAIKEWQGAVATVTIAFLYVLGIVFDRIVDRLFRTTERRIESEILKDFPVTVLAMRFSFGNTNDSLNQQLDYARTRMRIARASSVNFMLIAISISVFLLARVPGIESKYIAFTLGLGFLFGYVAFLAWKFLVRGHLQLAKDLYEYNNPQNKKALKKS